ncbi:MAG TPA: MarR family transcriptional regulator [Gaiellaceae bacterium]
MPAVAAHPDPERTSSEELLTALAAIRRATRRHRGRPAELSSLTTAQLELARVVRRSPGISVAGAAESMSLAPNTVSTLVGDLVAAGLLHRRTDPSDRRVGRLELTPTWKRKIDAWRDRRVTVVAEAMRRLPAADRSRLEAALPALTLLAGELEP